MSNKLVDGVLIALTEEEITQRELLKDVGKVDSVRSERNIMLKDSDWTQVLDAPVDQAAWATYRQALRDISAQSSFPETVEWPTQPE